MNYATWKAMMRKNVKKPQVILGELHVKSLVLKIQNR